jgi:ABC-type phosphate transport system substrate-binding protein
MHRVVRNIVVAGAAAAAIIGASAGPALADPPTGTTASLTDIVGLCPEPLTGVMNAFAAHYDSFNPTGKVYCWDETNPSTGAPGGQIITKASGPADTTCQIARPATVNAAIAAFAQMATDGGHPCIDFVSSARGKQTGDPTGLLWVGFAKDAVSWTTPSGGATKPASLTQAQLQGIYNCTITNWSQVGGGNAPIVPVLPMSGSAVRDFWLSALGMTTLGSCVVNGSINIPNDSHNPVPILEDTGVSPSSAGGACSSANWSTCNTGNAYVFANNPNAIFPYWVSSWIAQQPLPAGGGHGNTATFDPGVLQQPKQISGVSPIVTHSGSIDTINPSFSSTFQAVMWNVVKNAGTATSPAIPSYLVPIFGTASQAPHGLCSDTADIQSYGFESIGSNCGAVFQTS